MLKRGLPGWLEWAMDREPALGRRHAHPLGAARGARAEHPGGPDRARARARGRGAAVTPGWLVTIAGVAALAWLARGLALPVFLAMAFAYLLSPVVAWADALAIRRSVAVAALL